MYDVVMENINGLSVVVWADNSNDYSVITESDVIFTGSLDACIEFVEEF